MTGTGETQQHSGQTQNSASSSVILVPESRTSKLESRVQPQKIVSTIVNVIGHALVIALTVYLLIYSTTDASPMNLHVVLCTLGYVCLMAEAILILSADNVWTKCLTRNSKKHFHWILQTLGMSCGVAGVAIMYCAKSDGHFRSTHALMGLVSVVVMCVLVLLGYPVLYSVKLRKIIRPVVIKFMHNSLGIFCFVIGMAAQCLGYQKSWLLHVTKQEHSTTLCIVGTAILTLLALLGPMRSLSAQATKLFK